MEFQQWMIRGRSSDFSIVSVGRSSVRSPGAHGLPVAGDERADLIDELRWFLGNGERQPEEEFDWMSPEASQHAGRLRRHSLLHVVQVRGAEVLTGVSERVSAGLTFS